MIEGNNRSWKEMSTNELKMRIEAVRAALKPNLEGSRPEMEKTKLSSAQREVLKGKIAKAMENNSEFAARVMEGAEKKKQHRTKQRVINISRWIGILPAAVLGYALTNLLIWFAFNLTVLLNGPIPFLEFWMTKLLGPGIAGVMFISAGILLAPSLQKEVCMILCVILSMAMAVSIFLSFAFTGNYTEAVSAAASIIGALYCCFRYIKTGKLSLPNN